MPVSLSRLSPIALLLSLMLLVPQGHAQDNITTLQASLAYALTHNRALAANASQVEGVQAQVDAATGALMPRLDVATGFYRTNSPLNSFGTILQQQRIDAAAFDPAALNNPSYVNNYQSRLGLRLPLYSGGGLYAARHQAQSNAQASVFNLAFHQQQLIYQTIVSYVLTRQTLAQVQAQEGAVAAAEQRLKDAKALKERGMAIESDVMDAHVYVLRNQVALDEAKNQYANSMEALRSILGLSHDAALGNLQEPKLQPIKQSLATLLDHAAQNRADLLALTQQEQAAQAARQQSESTYLPQVNLTAGQEWNSQTLGLKNGHAAIGLTVSMNLFAGGADQAHIRAAEAARITLALQQEDKRQHIRDEINQAWRSLNTAKKKLQSEDEAYQQTTESLRIKALRHKQGLENTSELLASQVRADTAHVSWIRAKYDVMIAKAALLLAAGTLSEEVVQ